jgi:hypothetical protein
MEVDFRSACREQVSATNTVDFIVGLNARLQREIGYVIRPEPGVRRLARPPQHRPTMRRKNIIPSAPTRA